MSKIYSFADDPGALELDDVIEVLDDPEPDKHIESKSATWRVLIIDDDPKVHRGTVFALYDLTVFGRKFSFVHAYSATEAREVLTADKDFAVILLDVVMETDSAGLDLVQFIRFDMGMAASRIILRTGQPGYAPEMRVIQAYDIDDYRSKAELTQVRLFTTMVSALRSYHRIQTIELSRHGLQRIIDAAADLGRRRQLCSFSEGVLSQISGLLGLSCEGIVLARRHDICFRIGEFNNLSVYGTPDKMEDSASPYIFASTGRFAGLAGSLLTQVGDLSIIRGIEEVLEAKQSRFNSHYFVLYIAAPSGDDIAVHVSIDAPLSDVVCELLQVFTGNIAVGFDNASMFEHIESLAFLDSLTGLPNRYSFHQAVMLGLIMPTELTACAANLQLRPAVFIISVVHYESVITVLGNEVGDRLQKLIAHRLKQYFSDGYFLARLSDDTFGLLSMKIDDIEGRATLDGIRSNFASSFTIFGSDIAVSARIGYAISDPGDQDADRLIRQAGMALAQIKNNGRGYERRFIAAMENEVRDRLRLVGYLGEALHSKEFIVYYQPLLQLSGWNRAQAPGGGSPRLTGFEALLRWRRADGTLIPPDVFIPAAEESGRIVDIGEWVLTEACLKQRDWSKGGLLSIRMAVNVSVRQMREPGFLAMVERVIAKTGIDPKFLDLELTETMDMEDSTFVDTMHALRKFGIAIAIDDFGTGYSSLSRLHQLPVDHIKIDRSFVTTLGSRSESRSLVAMIIKAGHERGLDVIAEGVETIEQEQELIRLGCDEAQGYLYGHPDSETLIEKKFFSS
ncbi:MAG: EAL domain-containing protein [Rhodospirillaceae bacterium]